MHPHASPPRQATTWDRDYDCFVKAKDRGQLTFTLTEGDVTADLVVDFWVLIQARIRMSVKNGVPLEIAVQRERTTFGVPVYFPQVFDDPKLAGAVQIAEMMRGARHRKLAD